MGYTVTVEGIENFQKAIDDIHEQKSIVFKALNILGKKAHSYMLNYIEANTKTKTGNMRNSTPLTKAIDYDYINSGDYAEVFIGSIEKLNEDSPHWYVINYGRKYSGGDFIPGGGKFVPGAFQGNTFIYAPYSGTGIIPKKAIMAMNYIENTEAYIKFQLMESI